MPAGLHKLRASRPGGGTFDGQVLLNEEGFRAVEASFRRSLAAGRPAWIDFNHEDAHAAAWVKGFRWLAGVGILAAVEWTELGRRVLTERQFYSFSPAFTVTAETRPSLVAGLYEGHAAGGLVNAPAFGAAMPPVVAPPITDRAQMRTALASAVKINLARGDQTAAVRALELLNSLN